MAASHFVILLAHGSSDPHWIQPFVQLEQTLRQQEPATALAFMELAEPSLEAVITQARTHRYRESSVLPPFFAARRHLPQDVPSHSQQLAAPRQLNISVL